MRVMGAPPLYMVDTNSFTELPRTYPRPHFTGVWHLVEELVRVGRLISIDEVLRELENQDDEIAEWARQRKEVCLPLGAGHSTKGAGDPQDPPEPTRSQEKKVRG